MSKEPRCRFSLNHTTYTYLPSPILINMLTFILTSAISADNTA
jgi:hypothetical protein